MNSSPERTTFQTIGFVFAVTGAQVLNGASIVALNLALPTIGRDLSISQHELQWIISAYVLAFACILLPAGRFADIIGLRHIFLIGLLWATIWTLSCGFAPNGIALDIFRALTGLGAAANVPASVGLLGVSFPPGPAKNRAFACFSAGAPLGAAVGLVLGGVCTQLLGWRWVFYIMSIISTVLLGVGYICIPDHVPDPNADRNVDWVGIFLSTVGLVLFTFCLAQGQILSNGWQTPYIIALLVISIAILILFVIWEKYIEDRASHMHSDISDNCFCHFFQKIRKPLISIHIWRHEKFAAINAIGFFGFASFVSYQFFATLYFQYYLNETPMEATIKFIPMIVSGTLTNIVVGFILGIVSSQLLVIIGLLGTCLASLLFAVIDPSLTYWAMAFPAMIFVVLGADLLCNIGGMYVISSVTLHDQALAGGTFMTVTQIGTSIGLAVTSIVASSVTGTSTASTDILRGYRAAFWMSFALGGIGLLLSFTLTGIGKVGARKKDDVKEEAEENAEDEGKKDWGEKEEGKKGTITVVIPLKMVDEVSVKEISEKESE